MQASDYTILATSERHRDVAAFWRRQLADADVLTPALAPPPGGTAGPRRTVPITPGPRAADALARLADDDLGRFAVVTACVALAIARYGHRPAVLLRTPLLADGTEAALNVRREVPLVIAPSPESTLRQYLQDAAVVMEDSYAWQDYPIHMLCEHERLIDIRHAADASLDCDSVHATSLEVRSPVHVRLGRGVIELDVDTGLIEPWHADGLAAVISATLDRCDTLEATLREIPRVPDTQRDTLRTWSRGPQRRPGFTTVMDAFEAQVRTAPDAPAVRFGGETLSYRELNGRANRLAHVLLADVAAVRSGAVGIWMDRSPWMVVAVLGVLKAGLAYVPIDADCPPDRLAFLVRDSGIGRLLVDDVKAAAAAQLPCQVVAADRGMQADSADPVRTTRPDNLAYILYTSGSTGTPKGCAIEHHSLTNYLAWAIDYYWTTPGTGTMALFTPLAFDLTVPSLFCPLLRGRTLVISPQDMPPPDALLAQFAAGSGIDSVKLTPSHLRLLEALPVDATDVRLVIVGGEALTTEQVAAVHRLDPRIRVVNEYGPTEATVGCVIKDIVSGAPIVIGRPIANTRAYVLDEDLQPVAIGIRGELCIGGEGVARGYLDRPDLQAERFLPDPFEPGGRLYRTGDIARWRPDGDLECFGRADGQIKVRGYRIEPGEIEAALRRCAGVREAVVVLAGDALTAYVVGPGAGDAAALRSTLGGFLPAYMVPSSFVPIDDLPLTRNGKVDRARLPAPSAGGRRTPRVAPRTALETTLAGLWAQVLHLERVGVDDNFFEVGGHSLTAMTLLQRIHQALGLEMSLGEVLAHPTVEAMAALLESRSPTPATPIPAVPAADHYVVSHGQRRLWLIDRIDEASPAYNVAAAFDLRGRLDLTALTAAVDALVARHESLRTVFVAIGDEPRQRVLPSLRLPVDYADLRHDAAAQARVDARVAAQASTPFDLARGPLLRVAVLQVEDDRAVLALTMHHVVSDAWSMRVLLGDLVRLYGASLAGGDPGLPPLTVQYKDYAAWQRQAGEGDALRADQSYWLTQLAGDYEPLPLPTDFPRPASASYGGRHIRTAIDAGTAAALRSRGAARGVTPFMTLVAVVKAVLHRYTGAHDIRVGSPMAGRTHHDLANQIGFYVNTIVLRDRVQGDDTFDALLARVKRTVEDAFAHQGYPFDRLVDQLQPERDLGRSPLFDVMVIYDGEADPIPPAAGVTVDPLRLESGISKFDLTFGFTESAHGIDVEIEYRTDLFAEERIVRMGAHVVQALQAVLADASMAIDQLPLTGLTAPSAILPPVPAARESRRANAGARVAPRNPREQLVVDVLAGVLGRHDISVTDNFFHAGGDSIKAIQVVSRLAREGWALRVRDLFEAPVVERLAGRLTPARQAPARPPAEGEVPLTPIQRWFFRTQPEARSHYNQSVMLRFGTRLDDALVRRVGRALVERHDALRLRYRCEGDTVTQFYADAADPVEVRDLTGAADPAASLEAHAASTQAGLDLERGPLVRLVLYHLPDGDRLLAVIHHLVVDGVSWRILLDDLRTAFAQAERGDPLQLDEASDTYQSWSRALQAHAADAAADAAWWDAVERATTIRLPVDTDAALPLEAGSREQRLSLDPDDTAALLTRVPQAYHTSVQDVLLAALVRACRAWAGPGAVRIDLEGHGRSGVAGVDVSRTVGWFTSLYPVVFDIGEDTDPGRQLVLVKESLRRVPDHGLGYGLLRDGRPSGAPMLFNFLGQFDTDLAGFALADESRGPELGPRAAMTHDLVIGGWIADGRLHLTVRYAPARFRDRTITTLVAACQAALETLIAHCRDRAVPERTVSDLRYADQTTEALLAQLGPSRVEDVYPLSPMQEGLLFHGAAGGDAAEYVEQFTCAIAGPLDVEAFRAAWDRAIARHPALRTAFFWHQVARPVQVVFTQVDTPWTVADWRLDSDDARRARLEARALADRRQGFDVHVPPLSRFSLIRVGDQDYRFRWTSHHLILDGWSTAIVLQEVFADYQAAVASTLFQPSAPRPFGDYIDWLLAHPSPDAEPYWRRRLQDVTAPTPLPAATPAQRGPAPFAVAELALTAEATARIERAVRHQALTVNTLARGAWALVLGTHAGRHDVVFGATVSGRPAELPGVDTMVGLFINTLPIRVRIDTSQRLSDWLHHLQLEQADLDQHAYGSLADIQRCSGIPPRTPLFESLLVVENYPVDRALDPAQVDLQIDDVAVAEQTNYPLTLAVVPGETLVLRMSYDTGRCDTASANGLLREMAARFEAFALDPHQRVATTTRHRAAFDEATTAALREIAGRHGASMADVAQALVMVLCFRYSANEDLRCASNGARLSREALAGDRPFGEALGATAGASSRPEAVTAECDLACEVTGTTLDTWSDTGRFDDAFLQRVHSHLRMLAAGIAAAPDTPIARVPLLPDDERHRLLETFNRTDRDWHDPRTIVQYFEDQAAASPGRTAVIVPAIGRDDRSSDEVWTYGDLNTRANQIAHVLVSDFGVGPDVRVGVLLERSAGMVLALMAIEKAGGAYVPLDPDYPRELLQFMMEDSGAAVILTEERFRGLCEGAACPLLCLDTAEARITAAGTGNLESRVTGDHLAYVIYTSGSTGRPKGAMNTHRAIANRLLWMQDAYGLTGHDRVLQKTPFSFDVSVWEFFWPLMTGAQLVIAAPGGHRDAAYLVSLIAHASITTLHFVPSMLQAFLEEPGVERCTSLARVICSGEAITPELLRRYTARLTTPLHNLYGPTEAAVDVTAWPCDPAEARTMVPIGRPISNIRLYIVDPQLQPVPEGITGELVLGGVGVGRGYLNRPDLTAAKFTPDQFRPHSQARLYRTGDLARYRADGVVDFLGRIDHQVKLRGFRIELGEIESALLTHRAVRECVVIVREDRPGMARLVAYVVLAAGEARVPDDLAMHLQRTLPPHMVPGLVVPLSELPRLTNGKLDRHALPAPGEDLDDRVSVAPRDPVERRLVRVWEDVLEQPGIGVTDDFFALGGHSILALKLVSAIQREFGRSVPLAQLLGQSTIERLAVSLRRAHDPADWRPLVELRKGREGAPLFLLPGAGGNVIYFHALAQQLDTRRPVFGLQAIGLDGRTAPLPAVDAIAAANLEDVRRVQPHGPYWLAGHSFGGRVALEMAQQLLRAGDDVALLAVFDTAAPVFDPLPMGAGWPDAQWLARIAQEIDGYFGIRLGVTVDDLRPLPLEDQLQLIVERMQGAGAWAPGADRDQLRGYLQVYKANSQAGYLPYDAACRRMPIALFKALERDPDDEATPAGLTALMGRRDWGWQSFARGEVRVVDVPGAHLTMLAPPHVTELAAALSAALATTEAGR